MNNYNGEYLKELREKHGFSQSQIAELLHVSRQTVSAWETNRNTISVELIEELAEIYRMDRNDLARNYFYSGNEEQNEEVAATDTSEDVKPNNAFRSVMKTALITASVMIAVLGILLLFIALVVYKINSSMLYKDGNVYLYVEMLPAIIFILCVIFIPTILAAFIHLIKILIDKRRNKK